MKSEYLTRKVTINKESLSDLISRKGAEFDMSGGLEGMLGAIAAGGALHRTLPEELFPGEETDAKTFTCEEFAVRSAVAMRRAAERFSEAGEECAARSGEDSDKEAAKIAVSRLMGFATAILLDIEDTLFGGKADDIKEEKADE